MQAIECEAQPSPPEPTMRQERTIQATIFEVFAGPEIGWELKAISQWLDRQRPLVSLVAGDLRRHGRRETGRRGLPAQAVMRCVLLKQQRQLSYQELAFQLEDSASLRAFARLPLAWSPKNRCCTRPSRQSARRPGKRSIGPCWLAPNRTSWRAAPRCGSTARSAPRQCVARSAGAPVAR